MILNISGRHKRWDFLDTVHFIQENKGHISIHSGRIFFEEKKDAEAFVNIFSEKLNKRVS